MCLSPGLQQGRHVLSQGAVPGSLPSLVMGPGHCHHPHEVQVLVFAMAEHASLLHSHCTNPCPTYPLPPHFADSLHSHHLLGQPKSHADSLLAAVAFPAPVFSPWQVRRHLGGIWEGSYSSGFPLVDSFLFTGPCQAPLRNCLDNFFVFFSLTTGKTG